MRRRRRRRPSRKRPSFRPRKTCSKSRPSSKRIPGTGKVELDALERRLRSKEENIERRSDLLSQKESAIENREKVILQKESQLNEKHERANRMLEEQQLKLEQIAGITSEEAKNFLIQSMEAAAKRDAALMIRKIEEDAKRTADKTSREIIAYAIQRYAGDYVAENTVSVVNLPNDEMKGRIIGREGRNIRAIEAATGIDLIVDDTPEAVVLSSFDPVRREVARLSLERLITDGRIHPGRIEEIVKKVRSEVDAIIKETGERISFDIGVHDLHPELITMLGSLKFRTSYSAERPPAFHRGGPSDGDDGGRVEDEHQGGEAGGTPPRYRQGRRSQGGRDPCGDRRRLCQAVR